MPATKEYTDKILISVTDGKNLGEVKDVFCNADATKVVAAFTGKSGLINRKSLLVEFLHVKLFGVDAWLLDGSDVIKNTGDIEGADAFIRADDLRGREIQTDGGTKIGTIGDILTDANHNVLGFSLNKINVQGPIAENKTIARAAFKSLGDSDNPMIVVLEQAETLSVVTEA